MLIFEKVILESYFIHALQSNLSLNSFDQGFPEKNLGNIYSFCKIINYQINLNSKKKLEEAKKKKNH